MKVGTKSLLFGGHQVIIHPLFVLAAWLKLYKKPPTVRELICIIVHDWGYWGSPNMDGKEGEEHTLRAAAKVMRLGHGCYALVAFHSRFIARRMSQPVSRLCLPDKVGVGMMPTWLWVLLCSLSGEIHEYMAEKKYEINHVGPGGAEFASAWAFNRAYKAKCAEWAASGDVTIRTPV